MCVCVCVYVSVCTVCVCICVFIYIYMGGGGGGVIVKEKREGIFPREIGVSFPEESHLRRSGVNRLTRTSY